MQKYAIIAISVLAVVLLTSSSAWALYGNGSTYISDTIPTTMTAGTTYTPTVTMQNTGTSTWTPGPWVSGGTHPPTTSEYNFGCPNSVYANDSWGPRTNVGASVSPGATKVFTVTVTPPIPGTFSCRWQMVDEMEEWFGAVCDKTITVICGAPAADTVFGTENFDASSAGVLQGQAPGIPGTNWNVITGTNVDQALVVAGGVTGNAVQLQHKSGNTTMQITDGSWGPSWHIDESPWSKKIKLSFQIKPTTSVGDNFWQVTFRDWVPPGTRSYAFLQGSDTSLQAFDTSGGDKYGTGSLTQALSGSAWHQVDVVVDYKEPGPLGSAVSENNVYYFLDGNFFYAGKSDGGTTNSNRGRSLDLTEIAGSTNTMRALFDNFTFSTSPLPVNVIASAVQTGPAANLTANISWTRTWPCAWVSATEVKVCATNDSTATAIWDSASVAGANMSQMTGTLINATTIYAFQRDKSIGGVYGPWSAGYAFSVSGTPPGAITVVAPTGTIASKKPMITISPLSDPHTQIRVKVCTDSAGTNVVFDSGVVNTTGNGVASSPLANGSYYAFAGIGNAVGWCTPAWSAGLHFTVNTAGQKVDIWHMNEPNILTADNPGPNDGFGHMFMSGQYNDGPSTSTTVSVDDIGCGNKALHWNDRGASRSLRVHKLGTSTDFTWANLDDGVTFIWAQADTAEGGSDAGGASWRRATTLLMDKKADGSDTYFVALRSYPDGIGIISDTARGNMAFGGGWHDQFASWTADGSYHIIRLTGRNQVAGDYTSCVWRVYVDESPTAAITAHGCMSALTMEGPDADYTQGFLTDEIVLGHGSSDATGDIYFDWTAVNGTCDYAPGEWDPSGTAGFTSIGAAKAPGVESRPATIDGSMVITKVITHVDPGPDMTLGTSDDVTVQDGYFVQDLINNLLGAGVKVASSNTHGGAVAEGAQVTHIAGAMTEAGGCRTISNPTITILGSTSVQGTAMSQKTIMGPCVNQALGSIMDTTGMLVRVFGRVPTAAGFVSDDPLYPSGAYIVYVDDGSGAVDGRDLADGLPVPGIRVLIDASDPLAVVPNFGDYVMLEGIAGYESTTTGAYPNVRKIMYPTFTIVATTSS